MKLSDKYDYSLIEYININEKVKIICPVHGVFEQIAFSHLSGHQCQKCSVDNQRLKDFSEKSIEIHSNKYDYSLVKYERKRTKIKIICPVHGIFEQLPKNHLEGYGCTMCEKEKKLNYFITQSKLIHENKYNYSLIDNYNGIKSKIKIICPVGIFSQTIESHLNGHGCSKCATELKCKHISDFINESNVIHNSKYDYTNSIYINCYTKIKIICPIHGLFSQRPSEHLNGSGCPFCNESKGEREIERILQENNIKYNRGKKFKECKNKLSLPFDFYLLDYNCCIEFDGRQHFESIELWGGVEYLTQIKKHDQIKNNFCEKNDIKLIRIKYDENIVEKLKIIVNI